MSKRILLCDDEAHILRAAAFKFERSGFEVRCASDGEEAWGEIERDPPDLLITDCQMPRLDGIGLARRVHESRWQGLPVIMLTAKGFELSLTEMQEKYNVLEIVTKPFSPRDLVRRAEQALAAGAAINS